MRISAARVCSAAHKTTPTSLNALPFDTEILFLSGNQLNGTIPSFAANSAMRGLYVSDNRLNSTIPTSLCALSKLEALLLDENTFYGTIPSCIGNLSRLRQLFLFKNHLTGQVPTELSKLAKLGTFPNCRYSEHPYIDLPTSHC
jgi:Leucine-rich repeat (LRR) protein